MAYSAVTLFFGIGAEKATRFAIAGPTESPIPARCTKFGFEEPCPEGMHHDL